MMRTIEKTMDDVAFNLRHISWNDLKAQLVSSTDKSDFCWKELDDFIKETAKAYSRDAEDYYKVCSTISEECGEDLI